MKILHDLREKDPWNFRQIHEAPPVARLAFSVERRHLQTGDYTLEGHEGEIAIERKSPKDCVNTLTQDLTRFNAEFERMNGIESYVIVETTLTRQIGGNVCDYNRILASARRRRSLERGLVLMALKHPNIHWIFCNDRDEAERAAFRILYRFWLRRHPPDG